MKRLIFICSLLISGAAPASTPVQDGFAGAIRGCETWVLDPASWVDGTRAFESKVGLGSMMGSVDKVAEASLPPPAMRRANHFWRINASADTGYVLVVSDQLPICHITGGGRTDIRPAVAAALTTPEFLQHWTKTGEHVANGLVSTEFGSVVDPKFSIIISHPNDSSWSLDRLQIIATAQYQLGG